MKTWSWLVVVAFAAVAGWWAPHFPTWWQTVQGGSLTSPWVDPSPTPLRPLQQYGITELTTRQYFTAPLQITKVLEEKPKFTAYVFKYTTNGHTMSGQLNVPTQLSSEPNPPVIVMLRGYVPPEIFTTGVGTRNAATFLAENDYITVAPDFLGYGDSDAEPVDTWEARFIKPVQVIELINSIEQFGVPTDKNNTTSVISNRIGMWAHSNGGQIALTTLEILAQPIPTTLWAPVTAPFPYSVLFFGDEQDDEGKAQRLWIAQFERDYDVFDFSLTKHLDRLTGPVQLHHGTADEAALKVWSDEFVNKVDQENKRRSELKKAEATVSAVFVTVPSLAPIDLTYQVYPGADHNLQPSWNTVTQRDLEFFATELR